MEPVDANSILAPEIGFENPPEDNILTTALRALRVSFPKVPHSTVASELPKSGVLPEISLEKVSNHDHISDCWIVLYDRVYDVTKFLDEHPGGEDVILDYAGRDATLAFRGTGHSKFALKLLQDYLIGELPPQERLFRRSEGGIRLSDMPE